MSSDEAGPTMPSTLGAAISPFYSRRVSPDEIPRGQLHRVVSPDSDPDVDETKRNILKLLAVAGIAAAGAGGLVGGTLQYVQPPMIGISSYPRVQLIDVDGSPLTIAKVESEYSVETSDDIIFFYPLRNEPNFLLNLAPANGQPPSASNPGAWNVPGVSGRTAPSWPSAPSASTWAVRSRRFSTIRRGLAPRRSTPVHRARTPVRPSRSISTAPVTVRPMTQPTRRPT